MLLISYLNLLQCSSSSSSSFWRLSNWNSVSVAMLAVVRFMLTVAAFGIACDCFLNSDLQTPKPAMCKDEGHFASNPPAFVYLITSHAPVFVADMLPHHSTALLALIGSPKECLLMEYTARVASGTSSVKLSRHSLGLPIKAHCHFFHWRQPAIGADTFDGSCAVISGHLLEFYILRWIWAISARSMLC